MIRVAIIGVTGYAGEELLDILLEHPEVKVTNVSAKIDEPKDVCEIFPKYKGRFSMVCKEPNLKEIAKDSDLVFLALPHTVSMNLVPKLLSYGKKVIDLSADYRLKNTFVYENYYGVKHKDRANLKSAVYGLPELYRYKIRSAKLIANPGCYPTAAILALAPLVACGFIDYDSVVIDAKSGVTGAGRKVAEAFMFSEVSEDFRAYKVNVHQHAPEINQVLSKLAIKKLKVIFVPHLLPLGRGILETVYVRKAAVKSAKAMDLIGLYAKFYKNEPFVRIKAEGAFPRLKDVSRTNFCDIGVKDFGDKIIVISAIDNLLKGASGQAVQNMNIMYKLPETTGLL